MSSDRQELIARQNALADFGELALRSEDLQAILTEACRIVVEALGADLAKILEIQSDQRTALVRAGIGWRDGIVGRQCVLMSEETSEAFALRSGKASPSSCKTLPPNSASAFPTSWRSMALRRW